MRIEKADKVTLSGLSVDHHQKVGNDHNHNLLSLPLGQDPLGRDTWTTKIKKEMMERCATLLGGHGHQLQGSHQTTPGGTRCLLTG